MSGLAERLTTPAGAAQVIVVGAGPVGITAASMLAARGVRTVVVDRHPDVYPLPRAVHVDDEIRRVLQSLDPAATLDHIMMPTGGLRLLDAGHQTMAEFNRSKPVGEHGHPQANLFDQPVLERWLRDRLASHDCATIVGEVELSGFEQAGDGAVRATLRDVRTGEEATVEAAALLGCDGANSTVRELIGANLEDLKFEERWLVVDVRSARTLQAWRGVHQVCDPRRAVTFMQIGPDRYRWEFRLKDGESPDDLVVAGRLAELVSPWTKDVPFSSLEIVRQVEYTFKARVADRWRDRRVFLLGDAAHLTPPFIGQGLCAGVRDAANLTWKLAGVLDGRFDETVLDTYEQERAPHAAALVRKAVMVGRVMTGGQDAAAAVRKVALAALCRVPAVGAAVLDAPPPPLTAGRLVHRRRGSRSHAGRLLPQPRVRLDAGVVMLDTVLGDDYAVLTTDRPAPDLIRACASLGAVVLHVCPADVPGSAQAGVTVVEDVDGSLLAWLTSRRAVSVLVRPDRVVQDQDSRHDGGTRLAERLTVQWRDLDGHRREAHPREAPLPARNVR